jgi:hypothetical protein
MKIIKQDTKAEAKINESIRSSTPPCPGSKLEKSLTPNVLLTLEKTKSPTSDISGIRIEITII